MAIDPINNWKNITERLRNLFRSEFGNTLPIYIGHETRNAGTQYLRIDPVSSEMIEYSKTYELKEFTLNLFFYSSMKDVNKVMMDNITRIVSRIESLVHDNVNMTLDDSTVAYNCRVESTELNTEEEEEKYVVTFDWKCLHRGNLS